MGQEVAVVSAAELVYQRDPHFCVRFKFLNLIWIYHVFQITGDHLVLMELKVK